MADFIDLAQAREQEDRERHINSARRRPASPSRFLCEDCDAPIPEARRKAVPEWPCASHAVRSRR